ncbi:MAG: glycosyltransferase family 39 protein, partial [Planctomycetes bacterium]|nr:glycosyltransferase family 39 protein [Planctomycetota bacterium]
MTEDIPTRKVWFSNGHRILLIYSIGLLFRLVHFVQYQAFPLLDRHGLLIDSEFYDLWAKKLAAGHWMGEEAFFMGPLYPYLLGLLYKLLGPDFLWVRLVQVFLGSLTCLGVYLLGKKIFS